MRSIYKSLSSLSSLSPTQVMKFFPTGKKKNKRNLSPYSWGPHPFPEKGHSCFFDFGFGFGFGLGFGLGQGLPTQFRLASNLQSCFVSASQMLGSNLAKTLHFQRKVQPDALRPSLCPGGLSTQSFCTCSEASSHPSISQELWCSAPTRELPK